MKSMFFIRFGAYLLALCLIILFQMACRTQNESVQSNAELLAATQASRNDFGAKSEEYRNFPIDVAFFDPATEGANPGFAIQQRKEFINQSGLPNETNITEYKKKHTVAEAFHSYNAYIQKYSNHSYIKTFEQYGAWLILTRLDLLSQKTSSDMQMIYSLLVKLAETKYEGYQLLSYGISYLYNNNFSKENLKKLGTTILDYSRGMNISDNKLRVANVPDISTTNFPPEIRQSIQDYTKTKVNNKEEALSQIRQLVSKL